MPMKIFCSLVVDLRDNPPNASTLPAPPTNFPSGLSPNKLTVAWKSQPLWIPLSSRLHRLILANINEAAILVCTLLFVDSLHFLVRLSGLSELALVHVDIWYSFRLNARVLAVLLLDSYSFPCLCCRDTLIVHDSCLRYPSFSVLQTSWLRASAPIWIQPQGYYRRISPRIPMDAFFVCRTQIEHTKTAIDLVYAISCNLWIS